MPQAIYAVTVRVKPGRAVEARENLMEIKKIVLDAGAVSCRLLNNIAGPAAPSVLIASAANSLGEVEDVITKVQGNPAFQAIQANTDPPLEILAQAISVELE